MSVEMSMPSVSAMHRQTLANGLLALVACSVPALAVSSSDRQSVRTAGGDGQMLMTVCNAHTSAAAAVKHHEGGHPNPYPRRRPARVATTMPNPVTLRSFQRPFNREPSQYQTASARSGSLSSGRLSHLNSPFWNCVLGGSLTTASALVRRIPPLESPRRSRARLASAGGFGQPPVGTVAEHSCELGEVV